MRFEIGQEVWITRYEPVETSVECEDCGGTGRLRVMFADDSIVSIDCANCGPGYNPPTGRKRVFDRTAVAFQTVITGVEVGRGKTEWRTAASYVVEDENIFDNEADCLARGKVLAAEADREERERVNRKEKDGKSWGWHAIYHRREIKRAQEQIEYHTKKLAVASLKAKEDKRVAITAGERGT
jgi:hypothetical protein